MKKLALLVGINRSSLNILDKVLKVLDVNIIEVADSAAALEKLKTLPFNIIISKDDMTPITGLQLFNEIQTTNFKNIPFIIIANTLDKDKLQSAIQAGVKEYLFNPLDSDRLQRSLTRILDNQRSSNFT